jgi:hypothetical protein
MFCVDILVANLFDNVIVARGEPHAAIMVRTSQPAVGLLRRRNDGPTPRAHPDVIAALHALGAVEEQQVSTGALKGLHDRCFSLGDSD